jgi:drug/metabolite transporter (DMT)-like permease
MILLVMCVLTNVLVSILFKYFAKFNLDTIQVILANYIMCLLIAAFNLKGFHFIPLALNEAWYPLSLLLGLIFIVAFNLNAKCIAEFGVSVTTIAMKMSLLVPILISFLFFREQISFMKIAGIVLTLTAIYLVAWNKDSPSVKGGYKFLPILVWVGSSIVDVTLFLVDRLKLAPNSGINFTAIVFMNAFMLGFLFMFYHVIFSKKIKLDFKSMIAGLILGIPNFYSIYLVLKVLEIGWDGSHVFSLINVGVILLSALSALLIFKESLDDRKKIGMVISILAILCLSIKI